MSNNKGQLLQDPFLNQLRREHVPVSIYLVNGIKLQGQIESFDQYVVSAAQHRDPDGLQARHLHHRPGSSQCNFAVAGEGRSLPQCLLMCRGVTAGLVPCFLFYFLTALVELI